MKTLVIVGHPNPMSFNVNGILATVKETLASKNHEVVVRDLYQMNFNPVLSGSDFEGLATGSSPKDIVEEQNHISWAENIIVIHPTWWIGRPAILQGYYDRILSFNFAFTVDQNGARGLLKNKKALIINTAGSPEMVYNSWPGSKELLSRPTTEGVWGYCGIPDVKHIEFFGIGGSTDEDRAKMLEELKVAVEAI